MSYPITKEEFVSGMQQVVQHVWDHYYMPRLQEMAREEFGRIIARLVDEAIEKCTYCGASVMVCPHCGAPKK